MAYDYLRIVDSLPEENLTRISELLDLPPAKRPWLHIALVHRSFPRPVDCLGLPALLGVLQILGSALLKLAIDEHAAVTADLHTAKAVCDHTAALTPVTLATLAHRLEIRDNAVIGRLTTGSQIDAFPPVVTRQIIAGLYLSEGYEAVRTFVNSALLTAQESIPLGSSTDFKSLLQLHSRKTHRVLPVYDLLDNGVADHDQRFSAKVTVNGELSAEGTGRTKKQAEQAAAHEWLKRLSPGILLLRHGPNDKPARRTVHLALDLLPSEWHIGFRVLRDRLGMLPADEPVLIEALTHRSLEGTRDYSVFARLGATILEVAVTEMILEKNANDLAHCNIGSIRETLLSNAVVAELSELFHLDRLLMLGLGQCWPGITTTMRANAIQAVLAALLITRREVVGIAAIIPGTVRDRLGELASSLIIEALRAKGLQNP